MKILTVVGTRPELIRLSLIIKKLDQFASRHVLVHTGQNFTSSLSDIFFEQLQLRKPDYHLMKAHHSIGEQLSTTFLELERILLKEMPDTMLVLGDTNSALTAVLAERMGIPVVHMEAGNRCFDLQVPEEINRKVIDAVSSINMPYTKQSKQNLIQEGVPTSRIVLTGNPIYEVLSHYKMQIQKSTILEQLKLEPKDYFLATIHRAENVDEPAHLTEIMKGLHEVAVTNEKRIILSTHPRTKARLQEGLLRRLSPLVEFHEPFGFFEFVKLEQHALCVLTDSGTVQEECCIFHVPAVTVRKTTERPETVDCGSNTVTGIHANHISEAVKVMTSLPADWECPEGYLADDVSSKVVKFLLGGPVNIR